MHVKWKVLPAFAALPELDTSDAEEQELVFAKHKRFECKQSRLLELSPAKSNERERGGNLICIRAKGRWIYERYLQKFLLPQDSKISADLLRFHIYTKWKWWITQAAWIG